MRARAEREVASRYEAKLGEIEASMRELVAQNSALKAELRKWTEHTEAEVDRRSTIRRLALGLESRLGSGLGLGLTLTLTLILTLTLR